MKIRITTEREIKDEDYEVYIQSLRRGGVPIDGNVLKLMGYVKFTEDHGHTKATTTYEIVKQ